MAVIAGPTASGKSRLAMAIGQDRPATLINADSMQVYGELPVLTARPTPLDAALVPHRLYGVAPAAAGFSAARWRTRALAAIGEAVQAGRLPVLVGGTGLYLRALIDGLSPVPAVPPAHRTAAMDVLYAAGAPGLHAALARIDPVMAGRLAPGDSQRLVRAHEVMTATGRSLAEWQAILPEPPPPCLSFFGIVLMPPRDWLYDRINRRLSGMVAEGALDEVARFAALGLDPALPVAKALGVPALIRHLTGDGTLADALRHAATQTRHFAKRQMTWFRHQRPGCRLGNGKWHTCYEKYSVDLELEIIRMVRNPG